MGREIEVKISLDDKDLQILINWLQKNAKYIKQEYQEEYYLNNPSNSFIFKNQNGFVDASDYLRIRVLKEGKGQINLKKFKIDQVSNKSENIGEFEISVEDAYKALELYLQLGYTDSIQIKKSRQYYEYNNFEIVLDEVEKLGRFAEFELKIFDEKEESKKLYDEVFRFIKKIGFTQIKEQKRGYVSMLWNPEYDFSITKKL